MESVKFTRSNNPNWKDITVKSQLPAKLSKLQEISRNLWWVWNEEATDLFNEIDHEVWEDSQKNPVLFLEKISLSTLESKANDAAFIQKLDNVYAAFRAYMDTPKDESKPSVAYFSMEYGLTEVLKIYSGGLGVLAGDYLKEASDCNVNMTAIGFLYRFGYFTQALSMNGEQIAVYEPQNFSLLPLEQVMDENGAPVVVDVPYPDRLVHAYLWRVAVGRVSLYLLDTDNELNSQFDKEITHQLYGGSWENRLKQEVLLGIGGILALNKLGIKKDVYHCNEGHAALINIQRLLDLIQNDGLTFNEALEVVRATGLYTVHTPVPAGHDYFDEPLLGKYLSSYPEKLGISWANLMDLGRNNPGDSGEKFCMSIFACNTCQEVNGVSWLHGKVSQKMFNPIWKGYFPEELHVSYVTNGVHLPTWTATEWKKLYKETFGEAYLNDQSNLDYWEKIYGVSDEKIWQIRQTLKNSLINYIRDKVKELWLQNQSAPGLTMSVVDKINPNALTIGFGRRFATYKRAHLLFTDLDRLAKIVNNPNYPVQFIYTGKAHPADGAGQGLIKQIVEISRRPEFLGKIIFLENYNMSLAKRLIAGVDIWLNTPTRPLEASGTSGEKAQMNGVLNFSVLDGWWLEGYVKGAGWALTEKRTYQDQGQQDQLDAATIYKLLEEEIVPLYFAKNSKGYSPEWIQFIKNSLAKITPRFTMKRQLDDYISRFYSKLEASGANVKADNYKVAKELAAWKDKVSNAWDSIEVVSLDAPEGMFSHTKVGQNCGISLCLDVKDLNKSDIGAEIVVAAPDKKNDLQIIEIEEFKLEKAEGSRLYFQIKDYCMERPGTFKLGIRLFPKNVNLANRQSFNYVRWI
jgi:starch phosphorylase